MKGNLRNMIAFKTVTLFFGYFLKPWFRRYVVAKHIHFVGDVGDASLSLPQPIFFTSHWRPIEHLELHRWYRPLMKFVTSTWRPYIMSEGTLLHACAPMLNGKGCLTLCSICPSIQLQSEKLCAGMQMLHIFELASIVRRCKMMNWLYWIRPPRRRMAWIWIR